MISSNVQNIYGSKFNTPTLQDLFQILSVLIAYAKVKRKFQKLCRAFFSCFTYRNFSSVNKARPDIFDEKFDVKPWEDLTHIFPHVKGISPSSLPPCQIVLINKIKRANFVAAIWKNAVLRRHPGWKPEDHGWKKSGNSLIIMWFEGDQVPQSVEDILL